MPGSKKTPPPRLELLFEGLCVGGPRGGKPLASHWRRVTIPLIIADQPGIGAGYYEFKAVERIWVWNG